MPKHGYRTLSFDEWLETRTPGQPDSDLTYYKYRLEKCPHEFEVPDHDKHDDEHPEEEGWFQDRYPKGHEKQFERMDPIEWRQLKDNPFRPQGHTKRPSSARKDPVAYKNISSNYPDYPKEKKTPAKSKSKSKAIADEKKEEEEDETDKEDKEDKEEDKAQEEEPPQMTLNDLVVAFKATAFELKKLKFMTEMLLNKEDLNLDDVDICMERSANKKMKKMITELEDKNKELEEAKHKVWVELRQTKWKLTDLKNKTGTWKDDYKYPPVSAKKGKDGKKGKEDN